VSLADGRVTVRWRDLAHKNKQFRKSLPVEESRGALRCTRRLRASRASAPSASERTAGDANGCRCADN